MLVLITIGTTDYLKTIQQKHPEANILIMQNANNGLAYYEGNNTDLFESELAYDAAHSVGEMKDDGFVVMNHIPVTDEGRPIFEDRFRDGQGRIQDKPGFQAMRILRPHDGNTYIVLTQWADEGSFQDWKESDSFKDAHKKSDAKQLEKPSYSAGDTYVSSYRMIK
jgi:heme oxygenase (mycobilin-producing)